MKYYVYAIKSDEGVRYIGSTADIDKRIIHHNAGKSTFTSKYKGWKLIGYVKFASLEEARKYEKLIKTNQSKREGFYNRITGSSSIG